MRSPTRCLPNCSNPCSVYNAYRLLPHCHYVHRWFLSLLRLPCDGFVFVFPFLRRLKSAVRARTRADQVSRERARKRKKERKSVADVRCEDNTSDMYALEMIVAFTGPLQSTHSTPVRGCETAPCGTRRRAACETETTSVGRPHRCSKVWASMSNSNDFDSST